MTNNDIERATGAYVDDAETQQLLDSLSQCDISEFLGNTPACKAEPTEQASRYTPQQLITQKELAARLCVSVQTVRSWKECPRVYMGKRANGKGSACRYDMAEVVAWLKDNRRAYQHAEKTWMQSDNGKEVK